MGNSNETKANLLGMSWGAACNQLRKRILFQLICEAGLNNCFRCEELIINVADFSIEHKVSWMGTVNPVDAFFDMDNIAYSHLQCNVGASVKPKQKVSREEYRKKFNEYQREYRKRMTPEEKKVKRREKYLRLGT